MAVPAGNAPDHHFDDRSIVIVDALVKKQFRFHLEMMACKNIWCQEPYIIDGPRFELRGHGRPPVHRLVFRILCKCSQLDIREEGHEKSRLLLCLTVHRDNGACRERHPADGVETGGGRSLLDAAQAPRGGHAEAYRRRAGARRGDAGGAARQDRLDVGARQTRRRGGRCDEIRFDLPHLFHDQADRERGRSCSWSRKASCR